MKDFGKMPMRQHMQNQNGFTLLEILVAVGLMAVLFVMMGTSMDDVATTRNQVLEQAQQLHSLEVTFSRLFNDINTAFLADSTFVNKNEPQEIEFLGEAQSLNFATLSGIHYVEDKHDSDQHHVGYFLKEQESGDKSLMRRSTDFLMPEVDKGGLAFEVMGQIKDIQFEYYDSNKKSWKTEWDTKSVNFAGRLPQTVRVTLESYTTPASAADDAEERAEITTVWLFPIAMYAQKISF